MVDTIKHYGTPRHSGRYPWGSGDDGYQRNADLAGQVHDLKKKGLSEIKIAEGLGETTTRIRKATSIAKDAEKIANASMALKLKDKGMSNTAIGIRLGVNESVVRSWLAPAFQERAKIAGVIAGKLKD